MSTSVEEQLKESGCTDEDIAIMKQLFGAENFKEVKPLESNKSDKFGSIVQDKKNGAVSFKEHDPDVDTIYVEASEIQYFGGLSDYLNFIRSQIMQAQRKGRRIVVRTTEDTAKTFLRIDPELFDGCEEVDFS